MDALQLLFDARSGRDSLGAGCELRLGKVAAEALAKPHFIAGVQVDGAAFPDACGCGAEADVLRVGKSGGWLTLSSSWLEPVRLCRIEEAQGASAVARLLSQRLSDLVRWQYELHACALDSPDISRLLASAQRFMGFALVLFDSSFDLVGYALGDTMLTEAFKETVELGYAAGVPEDHQRRYRKTLEEDLSGFETVLEERERDTTVWVQPFQARHVETYFLHVMMGREAYRGMRAVTMGLVSELRSALERHAGDGGRASSSDFVAQLVTTTLTERQARHRAEFLGWRLSDSYAMVRAESFGESHPDARLEELCARLRLLLPGIHAAAVDHGIVGLLDASRAAFVARSAGLEELLVEEDMWMAVSDPIELLSSSPAVYRDLCAALAGMWREVEQARASFDRHVVLYDDRRYGLLVDALRKVFEEHDVVPNALKRVRAHDAAHGTEFERTLFAYVFNDKGKAASCSELGIHRSTLEYRLDRLRDHFGIDLEREVVANHVRLLMLAAPETSC